MKETVDQPFPQSYSEILKRTEELGFTMASDVLTCSLLRTLAACKQGGKFLELGTGTGLSTSWILDGMCHISSLTSIDNESKYIEIAREFLGNDSRLKLVCSDGGTWIQDNNHKRFDFIFADTWHGKYLMLDEVLNMLNIGGLYIVDDMLPQPNWPEGHHEKAERLIQDLDGRKDLVLTKQVWATGLIIAVKI